ncbi:PAS domain S-box protein [Archangium violaceum]|uniref:sensor histidine kinase n=1 Tax=Archangium violaceum TaxID=83451 RepID=UPI00194E4C92|nr:ATP-binding protein [Archangium violaceum]QRN97370.1 PAS domain S-box protein [Archangium violaceum]
MRRPWTFATRIAVGFAASLAIALAIATISALALRSVFTGNEQYTSELLVHMAQVEQLRRAFSEKLAAQRGYELTRNEAFGWDEQQAWMQFQRTLEELRAHATGDELRALEEVAASEEAHQAFHARKREALRRGGSVTELKQLSEATRQARERTEEALKVLARLTQERLEEGFQHDRRADRRALWLILSAATLGLLVAMGLAWVLTRALWPLHHEARASEERFRLLVEGVKDYALYLLDSQGRVASWNPGAERIQGWRAEEIIHHSGALLYPPEEVVEGQPQRDLEQAAREGRLEAQGWRLRKDGSRFWAESLFTPLRDEGGRLEGFVVLTRDITERRRLERAQRLFVEAERLFHSAGDPDLVVAELARHLVPDLADGCLLFLLTPSGELTPRAVRHVSPEVERMLWEMVHRRTPTRGMLHRLWEVLRTGRSELVTEVTPQRREQVAGEGGQQEVVQRLGTGSSLSVPLRAGGRTLGVLVLMTQRPERRFTETDQVFVEELAGRAGLSLDNARLLREAQAALELIGVASHDLGSPLQALQLMLGKLRRAPPADPDKLREGLTAAVRYTQRLGRLLHNLLDLSRLGSGRMELELGDVDLAELAHEAVARHAEQAAEVGSRLMLDVQLGVVGKWDRLRLERVLTNLLSNAFKYGKGRPIEVRVERTDGHGRLRVRDHGPGIPREQQCHIFERFTKAPTEGEKKEGFGLGLYIVRQLVEAHGGTVRVDSEVGEGATFTVELPISPASREVDAFSQPPGLVH